MDHPRQRRRHRRLAGRIGPLRLLRLQLRLLRQDLRHPRRPRRPARLALDHEPRDPLRRRAERRDRALEAARAGNARRREADPARAPRHAGPAEDGLAAPRPRLRAMADRPIPELEGVEHRFVDAGGLRTHVAEAGEGPPIVMLHGWPQNWWMWRKLIGPLADSGRRVICPDLRGYGWTAAPPGGYEPEVFARDVAALIEARLPRRARRPGRPRLGRLHRLPALPRAPRARPPLPGAQHPPPLRPPLAQHVPALVALLVPVAARRRRRSPRGCSGGSRAGSRPPSPGSGGPRPAGTSATARSSRSQFRDPDRAMGAALLYRHALEDLLPGHPPRPLPGPDARDRDAAPLRRARPRAAPEPVPGLRGERPADARSSSSRRATSSSTPAPTWCWTARWSSSAPPEPHRGGSRPSSR